MTGQPINFVALPSWKNPRLYMESHSPMQRWRDSGYYPAFRLSARLYRFALRTLVSIGLTRNKDAHSVPYFLKSWPGDVEPSRVVFQWGTPGPTQKLIARLLDSEGDVAAYVKLGHTSFAKSNLANERDILETLNQFHALPVPRVLGYAESSHFSALTLSTVPGHPLKPYLPKSPESTFFKDLAKFLTSFHENTVFVDIDEHPVVRSILRGGEECLSFDQSTCDWFQAFKKDTDHCSKVLRDRKWPITLQHGDFAPWNLLQSDNGALSAIDWEEGTFQGLFFLDIAHYIYRTGSLMHRWPISRCANYATTALSCLGYSSHESAAFTQLCLMQLWLRDRKNGLALKKKWYTLL